MKRTNRLDEYHWHEALDRAFLAVEWFDEFVEKHPAVRRTPSLRKMARELTDGLASFYQAVANADPTLKEPRGPAKSKRKAK